MRYALLVAAAYAGLLTWFAYHADNVGEWGALTLWFIAPLAASLLAGPWAALALPAAVLLALPAGSAGGEAEIPIWVAMMIVALVALPVIAIGSAARWIVIWYAGREGAR